jgi:hypothetical protein
VLARLERDDDVDAGVGQRQLRDRRRLEGQVVALAIRRRGPGNDLRIDVDADDGSRDGREQRRPIALAACGVEHAPAGDVTARECIAMAVLVGYLSDHAGEKSFACKFIASSQWDGGADVPVRR